MKKTMLNKNALRTLLSVLVLTAIIITSFCVTASAVPPIDDGENGVQWIYINADHTKLSGDGVTYEQVALPADCRLMEIGKRYVYMNAPRGYGTNAGASGTVYAAEPNGYLVYVDDYYNGITVYCRTDKVATLQGYFGGTEGSFVLRQPWYDGGAYDTSDKFSDLTDETAQLFLELSQKGGGVKMNVNDLETHLICELRFHDPSGLLTTIKGAIYEMPQGGNLCYVDYSTLDNSHFDADGNFSYRRGEVTVYPLEELAGRVASALSNSYTMKRSFTYEYYEYEDDIGIIGGNDYTKEAAIASFWVIFVLVGYLLPIAPLVIGLVFANSKKMSHPKRWYVVAGMAVLWMVLAVTLTVLLVV